MASCLQFANPLPDLPSFGPRIDGLRSESIKFEKHFLGGHASRPPHPLARLSGLVHAFDVLPYHFILASSRPVIALKTTSLPSSSPGLECPALNSPENGAVNVSGLIVSSMATYYCKRGFTLVGSAIRMCQNNGFWSGVTPLCQRKLGLSSGENLNTNREIVIFARFIHTFTHTYIHAYIHTYTHTYIHTFTAE